MTKNLVFAAVGDNSCHKKWTLENQDFDLALVYYGDSDEVANTYSKQSKYFFYEKTKSKLSFLQKLILERSDIFSSYDYVWAPDDDISISTAEINKIFFIAKEKDLWICQPALTGNITMPFLKQTSGPDIRYVSFVEQMAPLFKKDVLFYLANTFDSTESLWGIEHVWNALLKCPKDKLAVINSIAMNHTKVVGSEYSRFKIHPLKEIDILKNIYWHILSFPESSDLIEYNNPMEDL